MPDVSEDMIRNVFAEDSEPDALLVELAAAGFETPVRLTSWPGRIAGQPGRYGLLSHDGEDEVIWDYAPFTFKPGGSGAGEPSRGATLEVENAGYRVMEGLRQLPGNIRPTMNVYTVRVADPDVAEEEIAGAVIENVRVGAASVTISLQPKDFKQEPACKAAYVPSRVPALF